jgi:hypothetical protein
VSQAPLGDEVRAPAPAVAGARIDRTEQAGLQRSTRRLRLVLSGRLEVASRQSRAASSRLASTSASWQAVEDRGGERFVAEGLRPFGDGEGVVPRGV